MAQAFTTQSLTTLFSFPLKDPRWKEKALIGIGLTFAGYLTLGLASVFVTGYTYQIAHRIILENGEPYLPEWEDWGRLFSDGLRMTGALFILLIPTILLFFLFFLFLLISALTAATSVQNGSTSSLIFSIGTLFAFIPFGLSMITSLAAGIVTPAVIGHVVATRSWTAVFQVKGWWKVLRANLAGFLISYLVVIAVSFGIIFATQLLSLTLILICLVPILLGCTSFYLILIRYTLFAQAYRTGVQALAPAEALTKPL